MKVDTKPIELILIKLLNCIYNVLSFHNNYDVIDFAVLCWCCYLANWTWI